MWLQNCKYQIDNKLQQHIGPTLLKIFNKQKKIIVEKAIKNKKITKKLIKIQ